MGPPLVGTMRQTVPVRTFAWRGMEGERGGRGRKVVVEMYVFAVLCECVCGWGIIYLWEMLWWVLPFRVVDTESSSVAMRARRVEAEGEGEDGGDKRRGEVERVERESVCQATRARSAAGPGSNE